MGSLFKKTHEYITQVDSDSVMLEIGSDRGEGSTLYFAELAAKYNTELHSVDVSLAAQLGISHPSIKWHTAIGSAWCRDEYSLLRKKISVLYLDNFDYLWNNDRSDDTVDPALWNSDLYSAIRGVDWPLEFCKFENLPLEFQNEITFPITYNAMMQEMRAQYRTIGFTLTNSECQLEHFKQLQYLYPWLADDCIVVFDDTLRHNDCWIGKNGPGVIFLLAMGFNIVKEDVRSQIDCGVILKRGK
jgi:hypothetical protein